MHHYKIAVILSSVMDWGFCLEKGVKVWEMCICTTKYVVKKLVAPMDELERSPQLFSATHYMKMVQPYNQMV